MTSTACYAYQRKINTMEKLGGSLDPKKYLIQIPNIETWLKTKKYKDLNKEIGLIALATSLHIVVVSFFVGQILGFNDQILDKIRRDMDFYKIKEVLGLEEAIAQYKQSKE